MRPTSTATRLGSWLLGGCALVALCAASLVARAGAGIDLEPLASHVAQQEAATADEPATHAAWTALRRKFEKPSRSGLASDLAKLALVAKHADGALAGDAELRTLLGDSLDAADDVLGGRPAEMTFHLSQIKLQKGRDKVLAVVVTATEHHEDGESARALGDTAAAIRAWTKAERAFVRAVALAKSLIKKQGGGIGQF